MDIRPICFCGNRQYQNSNIKQKRSSSDLRKVIPVVVAMSIPAGVAMTSCVKDERNIESADWFSVAFNRLSDKEVENINKTRQAPKNTVFKKVDETETITYEDSDGETHTKQVKTGGWHYELVNNQSGIETGTTILPEGYTVVKNVFGFIEIVEDGTNGIFLKNESSEIEKRDTVKNSVGFLSAAFGMLSDEQVEKINLTRVVPEGTVIVKTKDGKYRFENNRLGITKGTRLMPEGYEMRKNIFGVVKIVPIDKKSIFLRDKDTPLKEKNDMEIGFFESQTGILSDEQIDMINKTGQMPDGTIISKDRYGNFYISSDITNLSEGTRTLPKGYEVKKNKIGVAVVVPIGTKGILIDE